MEIINVMKIAHTFASKIMKETNPVWLTKVGIKNYHDALRITLRVAHNVNKSLIKCADINADVNHLMHKHVLEIFGQKYTCFVVKSDRVSKRTLLGKTAPEGCKVSSAYYLSFDYSEDKRPNTYVDPVVIMTLNEMANQFAFGARFYN